jgi:hypothetical protein
MVAGFPQVGNERLKMKNQDFAERRENSQRVKTPPYAPMDAGIKAMKEFQ